MSSPVFNQEMFRFGRLLHYAGLAIVLVAGAATYNWFYVPVETNILDAEMKIEHSVTMFLPAPRRDGADKGQCHFVLWQRGPYSAGHDAMHAVRADEV